MHQVLPSTARCVRKALLPRGLTTPHGKKRVVAEAATLVKGPLCGGRRRIIAVVAVCDTSRPQGWRIDAGIKDQSNTQVRSHFSTYLLRPFLV